MNPYIGDRPLDPPEVDECETCGGHGVVYYMTASGNRSHSLCPDCDKESDMTDPGEPNEEPDL